VNPDFTELIQTCGEKAYNFAYRLTGNEQDARDLVQEAFTRAHKHFSAYDADRSFDSWMYRIMHNIFLDGVRRYAHTHTVSLDAPAPLEDRSWEEIIPGIEADPAQDLLNKERDGLLQKALDSLPIHYRSAVILCDVEGLSYDEIARIMSCPVGTVRSRIHQGRQLARDAYNALETRGRRLQ